MIKVSKTVKGGDKMNTKDYIETKKSKKLSDIFKGVLAVGLVVGSMITSTACKPNQPHENSSSTSKIETTTSEPTKIDEPIVRTDEQVERFVKTMKDFFKEVNYENQLIVFASRVNDESGESEYKIALFEKTNNGREFVTVNDINAEQFFKIYEELSSKGHWSKNELSEKEFVIKDILDNCSGEVLDIIVERINDVYATNQSSQDDLVR